MQVLLKTDDWVIVNKPSGISTHGAWPGDLGVVEWLALHYDKTCYVVSRLDKDTSGVLLLARSPESSASAQHIHADGSAKKTYLFVSRVPASGHPDYWTVDQDLDDKPASTAFRIVARWPNGLCLVEAILTSGKRHQVRRHAAASGLPLLGDDLYGGLPHPRVCLHASCLEWPGLGQIRAPMPASFDALQHSSHPFADTVVACAVAKDRRGTALDSVTDAVRLIHRGECAPDVAIDRFGNSLCIWDYTDSPLSNSEIERLLDADLRILPRVVKRPTRNPHAGGTLCKTTTQGTAALLAGAAHEHGLEFGIDLTGPDQTGLFLDQRDNRRRLAKIANGARVANLFAYTCSFSAIAAAHGCESVVSVDNSRSALALGINNLRRNGLEQRGKTLFAQDDVRLWLARQLRKGTRFDVVICDPPTFGSASSVGKSPAFVLEKEWQGLAESVAALLNPGGRALFCCNARALSTTRLEEPLKECFGSVVRHRTPLDFPETVDERHNRFFWCTSG